MRPVCSGTTAASRPGWARNSLAIDPTVNIEEFSGLVCLCPSSDHFSKVTTSDYPVRATQRDAAAARVNRTEKEPCRLAILLVVSRTHKSSQDPPLRTLRTQLRTPSSSTAAATSSSSTSRRRPSVAAGRSVSKQQSGPRRRRTRRWRAGASRCPFPRGRAAPRRRRGPARESMNVMRYYRGRRRRACEKPLRAFCTSCLHGSDSSLRGESRDASTSRRQLGPSMAMTLSMVSLRGRGVLACVRRSTSVDLQY